MSVSLGDFWLCFSRSNSEGGGVGGRRKIGGSCAYGWGLGVWGLSLANIIVSN